MLRKEAIQVVYWLKRIEPRRDHIAAFKVGEHPPKGGTVDDWEEYYRAGWDVESRDRQLHRILPDAQGAGSSPKAALPGSSPGSGAR